MKPATASSRYHGAAPADRPRELGRAVGLELLDKDAAEIIARTRPDGESAGVPPCVRVRMIMPSLRAREAIYYRLD